MIDLAPTSGLPLTLDEDDPALPVRLAEGLLPGRLIVRTLAELRETLADPEANGPDPAYFMYNGVASVSATAGRTRYNWRYDLTVLPPGRCGGEYLRTAGHYHPRIEGKAVAWPEVYEVLHGQALFILQRVDDPGAPPGDARVEDVVLLWAEAGQQAMLPPDYGHWTVNVTDAPLVICDWIGADSESDYAAVREARGPCCYVKVGEDGPRYGWNARYERPPEHLRHARPVDVPELGLVAGRPIFADLHRQPETWRYICDPDTAAADLWSAIQITRTDPFPR
jgi:glucose-6-phosphate isomerase